MVLAGVKRFTWKGFFQTLEQTGILSCSLLIIITFGNLFSFVLSSSGAIDDFVSFTTGLNMSPTMILLLIIGLYIMVGCMVDPVSMLIITLPAVMPVAEAIGYDPIWFGIVVVVVTEISLITPPVGLNVFILKGVVGDVSTGTIFKGVTPFWVADIFRLALIVLVPWLVLVLPEQMGAMGH